MIEKSTLCRILEPYTSKVGIALLDSEGFFVSYAKKLSEISEDNGCNISILTDFDDSGLLMAYDISREIPDVFRIGIDLNMINELVNLYSEDKEKLGLRILQERYKPHNALKRLKSIGRYYKDYYKDIEFVSMFRIEIDSVETAIGIEKFWEYIKTKLVERFPNRDYNRAVEVRDFEHLSLYWTFRDLLIEKCKSILESDVEDTKYFLENYEGLINDVDRKENEIRYTFAEIVDNDESLSSIRTKLQDMINELEESE